MGDEFGDVPGDVGLGEGEDEDEDEDEDGEGNGGLLGSESDEEGSGGKDDLLGSGSEGQEEEEDEEDDDEDEDEQLAIERHSRLLDKAAKHAAADADAEARTMAAGLDTNIEEVNGCSQGMLCELEDDTPASVAVLPLLGLCRGSHSMTLSSTSTLNVVTIALLRSQLAGSSLPIPYTRSHPCAE